MFNKNAAEEWRPIPPTKISRLGGVAPSKTMIFAAGEQVGTPWWGQKLLFLGLMPDSRDGLRLVSRLLDRGDGKGGLFNIWGCTIC